MRLRDDGVMRPTHANNVSSGELMAALRDSLPQGAVSAYLFGSRAEDRDHRESYIDIVLVLGRL